MDKKGILKVFISSTYRDLKDVRRLLLQEIGEALEAVAMEKFVPVDNSPHDEAIQHLEESDICIFIIGDYYGTIIEGCTIRTDICGNCRGGISYTHCEYRRARNAEKPHMVYIVENEISDILSKIEKFDLGSTEKNDILEFLRKNSISCSKARLFSGYTLQEIKKRWKIIKDKNKEKLDKFKEETSKSGLELYSSVKISKEEDYYNLCQTIKENLKEDIIRWYQEGRIKFADFAGRKEELQELLDKLHEKNSVCIVGTGGVGKTSLIQVALLLEKLSGKRIYALFKEYSYNYTRAGYSFAKGEFHESTFTEKLTLTDILKFVFQKRDELEDALKMDKNGQISNLIKELDSEGSILFIDDLQDVEKDVKDFVFRCGDSLRNGAVVAGVRQKGRCYSNIGPLDGMKGNDLRDMIIYLAKIHDVEQYVEDNIDVWSGEIFRITQGHPMLVDIIVKNADVFPDCRELRGITGITSIEDQEAVDEIMNRLIREILTKGELEIVHILSVFRDPVDKRIFHTIGGKEALRGIIKKGFFDWNREGKLVFTFNIVKELLGFDVRKEHYDIARKYYFEELGRANESEHPNIYVEIIYHLLKMEEFEEASALFSSKSEFLERADRGRVIELGKILSGKISDHYERAFILGFLGNLLLAGNEFSEAERALPEALEIYRTLAGQDPGVYIPDVAMTLNILGNLYKDTGKFFKAEKAYTETLKKYKTLADENPEVYTPDAAGVLSNLGDLYTTTERFDEAEKAFAEALEIYRTLEKEHPEAYTSDNALALNNFGILCSTVKRFSEAGKAYTEALKKYEALAEKDPDSYMPRVLMTLNNLGILYRDTRKFDDAEKVYAETLKKYKTLARKNPEVYMPHVAMTSNNLGLLYKDTGKFFKAEKAHKEALETYRVLARENPEVYIPYVALALNNLGNLYNTIGKLDEAEKAHTETLEIYRTLSSNSKTYMLDFAEALSSAGNLYSNVGKFDEAEKVYTEALEKYRILEKWNPEACIPHIALTLIYLGLLYRNTQRFSEAGKAFAEALEKYRALAKKNPDAYTYYVAGTLNNLGNLFKDVQEFSEAENAFTEALEIYRILAKEDPEAHAPYVAMTLINFGNVYKDLGKFSEAEKAFTEALEKYKTLAKKSPEAYTPNVAITLNNLGLLFDDIGEFDKAEKVYTQALKLRRNLAEKNPEVYIPDVATTLNNLGNLYRDTGRFSEAERAFAEVLEMYETLEKEYPEVYTLHVVETLINLGILYYDTKKYSQAEKAYIEALEKERTLVTQNPEVHNLDLAKNLNNLGNLYNDAGKFSEAETALTEALEKYRELAEENPEVYASYVALALNNLGTLYDKTKRFSEAEKVYTEALQTYRALEKEYPEVYAPDVATSLVNLGTLYSNTERLPEAEKIYGEALKIGRALARKNPESYTSDVILILNNLGTLYSDTRRYSEAEKAFEEAFKKCKQARLWFDAAKLAHNFSMINPDSKMLENSRRLLELAILFSKEEKYKYALKRANESTYWDLLENGTSMFGVLEALRDPALLSLDLSHGLTQKELERAQSDVRFQTFLVDTLLRKQVPCHEFIGTDFPKNLTFIYIQELKNYFLFFALENEGIHKFKCRKEFFSIGIKLLYLLWFQQRSAGKPRLTTHMSMFDELSRKWFKILPQGLKNLIREKEQIVFSPDSYCSFLPLEAMHIDGKPLCTEKTAVRATSLHQFLRLTSKKPRFDSSLIVGNPWPGCGEEKLVYSLPSGSKNFRISFLDGAEEEANALMRTLPNTTALLGEEATGKRFISEVSKHSLIHFSGHGSLGRILFLSGPFSGFPPLFEPKEFSDLRKAERSDGKRINMMEEWHPVTDLDLFDVQLTEGAVVFLNACETGQHRYAGGGYYQGLPAVFLKNGAHSIISSLVPIFDKHSKEFALHFYENLLHTHSISQSLKGAREKIRDTYKAQIYWIPYIHYGPPL